MYLAHISKDKTREQSIFSHLKGTAELAGAFASSFHCYEWGYNCGLIHDIGKYSDGFQKRLLGGRVVDHTTAGAKEAKNILASYCVSGHHSGLLDGGTPGDGGGEPTLQGRMKKRLEDYQAFQQEIEIPAFPNPPLNVVGKVGFTAAFFTRMIFSCLVDADYLDTEAFMSDNTVDRGRFDAMERLFLRLNEFIRPWLQNEDRESINGRRSAILKACLEKGKERQGLFQLTVPTGGGKTISSLAFALCHAVEHHLNHIIYVIPYTSIIEQNAAVFRDILGEENVLEDHCNVVYESGEEGSPNELAAENWDRPVIVTTNVQFFESLYSNRTSKCRKLHNLADSVIIFDEAQMLPVNYLKPCVRAITELVCNYSATAVLCTATQPSLQELFPESLKPIEICPDVKSQYEFFKRTKITKIGEISEDELIQRLRGESQVLCILNSRRRAQEIYRKLQGEGAYHLSTLMYPEHRKKLLQEIRQRLSDGKICRLIATSLVEAGVDFDFMSVYRELAGVDSVIQAAGRCNREGKRGWEESNAMVFTLSQLDFTSIHIPAGLRLPITVAGEIAEKYEDIASPEAIHEYFQRLYHYKGEGLDTKDIVRQFERASRSFLFPFASVADQFHLIESDTKTIVIDVEPKAAEIAARIRRGECTRQLMRDVGHYCVNVYPNDYEMLSGAGRLQMLKEGFYCLRNPEQYSMDIGLVLDVERGDAAFF